eukprot:CAMPEP_0204336778 /NCGR_PEP_ID=MMETSP0469-20131031/19791_1 /ASSEMBLY_ACC=CAM_ASM_000384 /TAXON_ID=2969 /ORGANISM="Oxyrrhis marina" /LENGTH=66 /DNA_ID=CAMNT_0051320693 /DNA_START=46 /DNA_END=243 /DNA_ORIENTATION=-
MSNRCPGLNCAHCVWAAHHQTRGLLSGHTRSARRKTAALACKALCTPAESATKKRAAQGGAPPLRR